MELIYGVKDKPTKGKLVLLALQQLQAEFQNITKDLEKEYNQKKNSQEIKKLDKFYDLIEDNKLFIKVENTDSNLLKENSIVR